MTSKNTPIRRIMIVGDSGRGKSTLAQALSQKLKIKHYSTDDFYWKIKFTVSANRERSIKNISKIYQKNSWIVEGTTRSLIKEGIEKSDQIIYLIFPHLIPQLWILFKRKINRKEERWQDLFGLFKHSIYKRYKLGPQKNKVDLNEMLKLFPEKIIKLHGFKEIDHFVRNL